MIIVFGLLILNLAISWWNARATGLVWVEAKSIGGWIRFMTWTGWVMAALGFTWCYVVILTFAARALGYLDATAVNAALALGYLVVIPGMLVSGFFIWIDSVVRAWRQRDLPSIGTAAWNTFAEAHNAYGAIRGVGGAFKSVGALFTDNDEDEAKIAMIVIVVLIVVAALAGGVATTEAVRRHYAGSRPLPVQDARATA